MSDYRYDSVTKYVLNCYIPDHISSDVYFQLESSLTSYFSPLW